MHESIKFHSFILVSDCALNIHRQCVKVVEENCPGPLVKKEKGNDRISKLMEKIRPEREARRKPSTHNFTQSMYICDHCGSRIIVCCPHSNSVYR